MVFSTITSMPFTVYSTFVLEEKHGFNKQVNCSKVCFLVSDNVFLQTLCNCFNVNEIVSWCN